jgi:hypothetical protein
MIIKYHLKYQSIDRLVYAGSEEPDICLAESGKASLHFGLL